MVKPWIAIGQHNLHASIFEFSEAVINQSLPDTLALMVAMDRHRREDECFYQVLKHEATKKD